MADLFTFFDFNLSRSRPLRCAIQRSVESHHATILSSLLAHSENQTLKIFPAAK